MQLNESGSSDEEVALRSPVPKWAKRRYVKREFHESESSDDDLVLGSPKWTKNKYEKQMDNMGIGQADRDVLIPMLVWQQPRANDSDNQPVSPDRSSSPLYEVELTASDEDEDGSVLELVIPLQSSRYNKTANVAPLTAFEIAAFFGTMLCCFRGY